MAKNLIIDQAEFDKKRQEAIDRGFEIDLLEEHIERGIEGYSLPILFPETQKLVLYLALCTDIKAAIHVEYCNITKRACKFKSFNESVVNQLSNTIKEFAGDKLEGTRIYLESYPEIIKNLGYAQGVISEDYKYSNKSIAEIRKILKLFELKMEKELSEISKIYEVSEEELNKRIKLAYQKTESIIISEILK